MSVTRRGFIQSIGAFGLMFAGSVKAKMPKRKQIPHEPGDPSQCHTCNQFRNNYVKNKTVKNKHRLDQSLDLHHAAKLIEDTL